MNGLMAGKRGLIMGLANDKSLAWGIAKQLSEAGAELAFSYQGAAMEKRVRPLAEQLGVARLFDCDVGDMAALDATFDALKAEWPTIDFVVHAIGFSDKSQLRGRYYDTTLDNFLMTMNISAYSLVAVAKRAREMMPDGGALRERHGLAVELLDKGIASKTMATGGGHASSIKTPSGSTRRAGPPPRPATARQGLPYRWRASALIAARPPRSRRASVPPLPRASVTNRVMLWSASAMAVASRSRPYSAAAPGGASAATAGSRCSATKAAAPAVSG